MIDIFIAYAIVFTLGLITLIVSAILGDMHIEADSDGFPVSPLLLGAFGASGGVTGMLLDGFSSLGTLPGVAISVVVGLVVYVGVWKAIVYVFVDNQVNSVVRSK